MRVALVTATRGDGGQNEIGTELFDALGILRTEELLAAHRFDGAEQYFARAVDFGYSFSTEETFEKWGRDEILGDYVRHIRTIRPDVLLTLNPEGDGGGRHHQASAVLAADAFRAAADPARFPEQIRDGLRPWQVRKLYRPLDGFGRVDGANGRASAAAAPSSSGRAATTIETNVYEPLLGCTIAEAGGIASGMHLCQGRVPMVPAPGSTRWRYHLAASVPSRPDTAETSLFAGLDVTLGSLARYAGERPPDALTSGLATIAAHVESATRAVGAGGPAAAIRGVAGALTAIRDLLGRIGSIGLDGTARFEIESRLRIKEDQAQEALVLAQGLRLDATAADGVVVRGQSVRASIVVANRGDGQVAVRRVSVDGFSHAATCASGTAASGAPYRCEATLHVPIDARLTDVYWQRPEDAGRATLDPDAPFGVPFRPTPFTARIELEIAGAQVVRIVPLQHRYGGAGLAGEKQMELHVVPEFAVSVAPRIAVIPLKSAAGGRELRVTVVNGHEDAASAAVRLHAPAGWRVKPAQAPIRFAREDESVTTRFTIVPPPALRPGSVEVTAEVIADRGSSSRIGYQVIEYPHVQRRHKLIPASASVKTIDVAVAPRLSVGYIMGAGDQVPGALQQLGARVTLIDADEMAWGDLSTYDAIVTGVRAYERRADLRASNHRLLAYVEGGGTVIVQYNKMEFNEAKYGPYKAEVTSNRVTDEHAPVTVLQPAHPVFSSPNRIGRADWEGWVQERGTYFLGALDPKYLDLVEMQDPFELNPGPKRGALVEARYGKGRWIYVGLGLWRQAASGTGGAYRLFANLISLGKPVPSAKRLSVEK
jgi:hypothetical protein